MPPQPLFDLARLNGLEPQLTREQVYAVNPHRYEFQLLDGMYFCDLDKGEAAGWRDVRDDEFWVRGHIPGRPIFPGVLMIETAAQLVSYAANSAMPGKGFLGFGGVDDVKFRGSVVPGERVVMLGRLLKLQSRRCVGATQAFVGGRMVYEGTITGMWL